MLLLLINMLINIFLYNKGFLKDNGANEDMECSVLFQNVVNLQVW